MKKLLSILLLGLPLALAAQNPVVRDQFTADPTARVFNNKVYLFCSHDIIPPTSQSATASLGQRNNVRQDWFCMADYHVFSSENLTDWQDHGVIISQEQVPWGNPQGYAMWAPDCVFKKPAVGAPNGKYYFYLPNAPKGGRGFVIGVATADRPEGPYKLEPEPIKGVSGIDPGILLDDDGSAYIYWGGMGIRGAKLKDDMTELDGELQEVKMPRREGMPEMPPMMVGGEEMKGLPDGFKEGPFAFKRNGWYYLTFPWVRGETGEGKNPTETLAYAMSKNPLGPWDFKGIIMAEHPNGCWTNHHSLVEYKGQWYLFYHTNFFSPKDDKRRSVCIEKVFFNADGTIREVKETMRGVGTNLATERIEIDRFSEASVGVSTENIDTLPASFRGACVNLPQKGSWVKYNDVDFSCISDGYMMVSARAYENTEFCIREKSAKGKVLGRIKMTVKSEGGPFRRDMSGQWLTQTIDLEYTPKGVTDLVITCEGEPVSIDWVRFKNRSNYFTPVAAGAAPSQPDANGFIRRWMLLEPIRQNVRSNVVFTNTWLREAFAKTYFKDQLTMLPRDGQKVKAVADKAQAQANFRPMNPAQVEEKPQTEIQTVAWHALDSENYNVKLFRFAEKWGQQTYGSLFWAVTVIDSPEDMPNVRLAAGSNGASIWWLNGEEVLLLEGDRRMVEDDGMSARLTLKKGRNVLRCAVINGPGLSDMCVRFLDEKGNPITNLEIK